MNFEQVLRDAQIADENEAYAEVIRLASHLIQAGDPWIVRGFMLRGSAYEHGSSDGVGDIAMAVQDFRQVSILAPHSLSYQCLARVLMKSGNDNYPSALRFLGEASSLGATPELYLGYAHYYQTCREPDLQLARKYFLRAALRGRFQGFFGYSHVSRMLGQPIRAAFVDAVRVVLGPFIWLVLGAKARYQF